MSESRHRLPSAHLDNERDIWVRLPAAGTTAEVLLVFLDAELYRERVGSPAIVDSLEASGHIPPAIVVHVSHASTEARWLECPCHPPFAAFVIDELMPWLARQHPEVARCTERVLIGLSYTGLAASFVALQPSSPFTSVISQSGSYWSDDEWLTREYASRPPTRPVRHHVEVGRRETQTQVRHKEDVLQVASQRDAVHRFRDTLERCGYVVNFHEFDGGHEFDWWRRTLPDALCWAMRSR